MSSGSTSTGSSTRRGTAGSGATRTCPTGTGGRPPIRTPTRSSSSARRNTTPGRSTPRTTAGSTRCGCPPSCATRRAGSHGRSPLLHGHREHRRDLPPRRGHRRLDRRCHGRRSPGPRESAATRPVRSGPARRSAGQRPARRPRAGDLRRGTDGLDRPRGRRPALRRGRNGRILAYQVTEAAPFTPGRVPGHPGPGQRLRRTGLLGLAFHPNFATNRYFFVYYTAGERHSGDGDIVIARYRAAPRLERVDPEHRADPPDDRALGDSATTTAAGSRSGPTATCTRPSVTAAAAATAPERPEPHHAPRQAPASGRRRVRRRRLGALLHDPAGNPFAASAGTEKKEIWAWGLRNPWRISFDRLTGDLFIADVGQDSREEVDFQPAGSGAERTMAGRAWRGSPASARRELPDGQSRPPILDYSHGEGCSVTGGYRYRGQGIPTLNGVYVFGDYCRGDHLGGRPGPGDGSWTRAQLLSSGLRIKHASGRTPPESSMSPTSGRHVHRFAPGAATAHGDQVGERDRERERAPTGSRAARCAASSTSAGQLVELTAPPARDSWLAGWSGACGGTGGCSVLMDGDRAVTATFNLAPSSSSKRRATRRARATGRGLNIAVTDRSPYIGTRSRRCPRRRRSSRRARRSRAGADGEGDGWPGSTGRYTPLRSEAVGPVDRSGAAARSRHGEPWPTGSEAMDGSAEWAT